MANRAGLICRTDDDDSRTFCHGRQVHSCLHVYVIIIILRELPTAEMANCFHERKRKHRETRVYYARTHAQFEYNRKVHMSCAPTRVCCANGRGDYRIITTIIGVPRFASSDQQSGEKPVDTHVYIVCVCVCVCVCTSTCNIL